jgi:hypothetical protein
MPLAELSPSVEQSLPSKEKDESLINFEALRDALEQQVDSLQRQFKVKHRNLLRWADRHGYKIWFLGQATGRVMMAGGLMMSLLTSAPQAMAGVPHSSDATIQQQFTQARAKSDAVRATNLETVRASQVRQAQLQQQMMDQLHQLATNPALMDDSTTSANITAALHQLTGVPLATSLDGYQLNTNIGRIGAEQHLKRYPGDDLAHHDFTASGMAPGLGAYGYFASSAATLTSEAVEREKWYVAIQTFKSPNWSGNVSATYNWFKYRKVLIYHPQTGRAVVGDVGDAGPGLSTGKNYGGSPEVMAALGAVDGRGTPPVVMLFVNDPTNSIPLGPVQLHTVLEAIK